MKTTTQKLLLVLLTLFIGKASYSQTYDVYIANEALISNTQMEFDVFIKSNGATGTWALRSYQSGYQFSTSFVNGGSLSGAYVASSSELEGTFGKTWGFSYNVANRVLNQSANTGSSCPGALIGTTPRKIGRFRVTNTATWGCAADAITIKTTGSGFLLLAVTKYATTDCSDVTPSTITVGATPSTVAPNASILTAGSSAAATVTCGGSTNVTVSATGGVTPYTGTGVFSRGAGDWEFTVTDNRGCTSVTNISIGTSADVTDPNITACAGDLSATADEFGNAPVPDFTGDVSATDNCTSTGSLVITQSPLAGASVGVGPHVVTITVKDAANNDVTCQATFTVNSGCSFSVDTIVGPRNACPYMAATGPNASNNATYTIATEDANGFTWTVPALASIITGQGTNTITVHYASTFVSGSVGVTVTSLCGDPVIRTVSITKATPLAPAAVFGPLNACSYIGTATQVNYYINPVANAITYRWTLPPNVTLVSATPDSTSIMVTFEAGYVSNTVKAIKVKSISGCANSSDKSITVATTQPATPGSITGPFNVLTNKYDAALINACVFIGSDSVATYYIRKVANATSYIWTVPTGATIMSHPAGTGVNDTTITVSYDNNFITGTNITVQASSICGTSLAKALVIKRILPATPGTMSGPTNVCPLMEGTDTPGGTNATYSVLRKKDATSYTWSVPLGASIVSHPGGAGTPTDTSIVVHFDGTFTTGSITVASVNGCGSSANRVLALKRLVPPTPGAITGTLDVCPLMEGTDNPTGTDVTYSIKKVLYATGYNWGAPAGATIVNHPGGAGVNDTSIVVHFSAAFVSGSISVQATNNCAISATKTLVLKKLAPATPGTISTTATDPCPTIGSPGGVTYTINNVLYATSYNWIVPSGATIRSGQGTTSIIVDYTNAFISGSIQVQSVNNCSSSLFRSLAVVRKMPATPGTITVGTVSAACPIKEYTYTIAALPLNATSVVWTVPVGANIVSGQNTLSIDVTYPATGSAYMGAVTVTGTNNCGSGTAKSLTVNIAACAPAIAGTSIKQSHTTTPTPDVKLLNSSLEVKVFPNPSINSFKLQAITTSTEVMQVRLLDMQGREYRRMQMAAGETLTLGSDLKAGSYMLEVKQGTQTRTTRIIKL